VLRAAAVQGMSRLSSAILFQYNHPTDLVSWWPPKLRNTAPKSVITRAGQSFLQNVAFPLQSAGWHLCCLSCTRSIRSSNSQLELRDSAEVQY
jgi:hypothetical protein